MYHLAAQRRKPRKTRFTKVKAFCGKKYYRIPYFFKTNWNQNCDNIKFEERNQLQSTYATDTIKINQVMIFIYWNKNNICCVLRIDYEQNGISVRSNGRDPIRFGFLSQCYDSFQKKYISSDWRVCLPRLTYVIMSILSSPLPIRRFLVVSSPPHFPFPFARFYSIFCFPLPVSFKYVCLSRFFRV